jgi:hypothetical protein
MAKHCGAKNRKGGSCKQPPMPNGRCRYHGGLSTGPKDTTNSAKNSLKHGIYATRMTEEEIAITRSIQLGTVDDELRLTRIRLRRALECEANAAGAPELEEVIERDVAAEVGARREEKSRVRDYVGIIDKLTSRIESLERTRRELLKVGEGDDESDKEPIGKIIVEVVSARATPDDDGTAG